MCCSHVRLHVYVYECRESCCAVTSAAAVNREQRHDQPSLKVPVVHCRSLSSALLLAGIEQLCCLLRATRAGEAVSADKRRAGRFVVRPARRHRGDLLCLAQQRRWLDAAPTSRVSFTASSQKGKKSADMVPRLHEPLIPFKGSVEPYERILSNDKNI